MSETVFCSEEMYESAREIASGVDVRVCEAVVNSVAAAATDEEYEAMKSAFGDVRKLSMFLSERWEESGLVEDNFTAMVMFCGVAAHFLLTAAAYSDFCKNELDENPLRTIVAELG